MRAWRFAANIAGVLALAAAFVCSGKAADSGALTYVEFTRPTEVPGGKVLPEGLYAFKLSDGNGSAKVVQIFLALQGGTLGVPSAYNANKPMTLSATVLAVPDYRTRSGGRDMVAFAGAPTGGAQTLKAFNLGPNSPMVMALVYPQARAAELAKSAKQPVPSMASQPSANIAELKSVAVKGVGPNGQEVEITAAVGAPGAAAPGRDGQRGPAADAEAGGAAREGAPTKAANGNAPQGVPVSGSAKGIDIMAGDKIVVLH